jgi:hypothetical protein
MRTITQPAIRQPAGERTSPRGVRASAANTQEVHRVNKDDWKAFLRWLETAEEGEFERKALVLETRMALFREPAVRADARRLLDWITIERNARRSLQAAP